jgi:hypothetical protein
MPDVLDIRTLAADWRTERDDLDPEIVADYVTIAPGPFPRLRLALAQSAAVADAETDLATLDAPYAELCAGLGLDADPDELERHGDGYEPTLISEDRFTSYARELAEDIGAVPEGGNWPTYCIDWERAADELRVDYLTVEYDGETYLIRA